MSDLSAVRPGEAVGIVGGGQLGRMLALAAAQIGLDVVVLDPDPDAPAARVARRSIEGAYDDAGALRALAREVRVATYEFENVPVESAERLAEDGVAVRPGPAALRVAQDRAAEKEFLSGLGIAVAPWRPVADAREADSALASLGPPAILKTRRLGYDGKGQRRVDEGRSAAAAFEALAGAPSVMERRLEFLLEFSIVGARGTDGTEIAWDAVRNVHEGGILRSSRVPAGIPDSAERDAREAVRRTMSALDYVGVIAVEFFLLPDARIVANEIAPRVHNSGHWTLDACDLNQFEAHMRAVAGWPLSPPRRYVSAEMRNLLGGEAAQWQEYAGRTGARLHLYGKRESRTGRKMGHVTRIGSTRSEEDWPDLPFGAKRDAW